MSKKSRRKQLSDKVRQSKRAIKPIDKKPNPFELKFNKQKHAVAGQRKQTAAVGLPLVSRHRAHEQRKRTLLNEYNRFGKANQIVDRRLGERDVNLTPDQKMALRFVAERRRRYKGDDDRLPSSSSNFQLTGVDSILTHRGKAITDIEKLNDRPLLDDDEDEEGQPDFMQSANFGGGFDDREEDGEKNKKSRKELIDEMIANSKRARFEMQMQREQATDLTADLDAQWKEAVNNNLVSKWMRNKDEEEEEELNRKKKEEKTKIKTKEQKLDYDRLVHEMIFEPKAAKGGDKLKKKEDDDVEEDGDGEENPELEDKEIKKNRLKEISKSHVTGDDDIGDFQRFKRQKEKPFVVQYDTEGRLINEDQLEEQEIEIEPPTKKKVKFHGIEFLEPRIETNFNPERKRRPIGKGDAIERQQLKQKYKKELRGTIRELRKDNEFLARQQLIEQQQKDSDRRRKVKSLMKSLVSQETECNKLKKQKKKL